MTSKLYIFSPCGNFLVLGQSGVEWRVPDLEFVSRTEPELRSTSRVLFLGLKFWALPPEGQGLSHWIQLLEVLPVSLMKVFRLFRLELV